MDPNRLVADVRALLAAGRVREALARLDTADADDANPLLLVLRAQTLQRLERLDEAGDCAERAAAAAPEDLGVRLTAADTASRRGRFDAAAAHLDAARRLAPHSAEIAAEHARALLAAGHPDAALAAARAALERDPVNPTALDLHARASLVVGAAGEAEASLATLLERHPERPDLWRLRAEAALAAGRPRDALRHARSARVLAPVDVRTLDVAARAADAADLPFEERAAIHRDLVRRAPTARRCLALAIVYWHLGDYAASATVLEQAVVGDPECLPARWARMNTPPTLVPADAAARARFRTAWAADLEWFERRLRRGPVPAADALETLQLATNFFWHYTGEPIDALQRRYAAVVAQLVANALPEHVARPLPQPHRDGPLKVAVVSPHLHEHTVNRLFGAMLADLPRSGFRVAAFQIDGPADAPARWSAHWAGRRPLREWIALIDDWRPDVLVLPEIGMNPASQVYACLRLAPVQVALWGHPIPPRFPAIDRWFGCRAMEPEPPNPDPTRIDLDGIGACFAPPAEVPVAPVGHAAWAERRPAYGVVQSVFKLAPEFDGLLARILAAVPDAVVHATPSTHPAICAELRARWAAALAEAGADPARALGLIAGQPRPAFLGLLARLDVNLDSPGWSGGNTTLEALWFDLPTVTLPGPTLRSRHTAAILAAIELPQLIARDADDYVRIAIALGRDAEARAAIRDHIARHKHRLYRQRAPGESLAAALWALAGRQASERPW